MKFSVILNTYDTDRPQRHATMACLAAIRKFTDPPYEIIVVDNEPTMPIRDEYKVLQPFTTIEVTPKETVYESYNIGAKAAKTDILMFIQNDVYVHERTLNKLAEYIGKYDVAFPQQVPISRENVLEIYKVADGEEAPVGGRDAGLMAISRQAFNKVNGWDGRFRNLLGEAAFYSKLNDAGCSWTDRTNCFITHIMAGNNLKKDDETYNAEMGHDAELLQAEYR